MKKDELKETLALVLVDKPIMARVIKDKYMDEDLWLYCIEKEPTVFKHMKNPSYPICLAAVQIDGYNLKYIAKKMIDERMCVLAVKSNPIAIQFVPTKFKTNAMVELAIDSNPEIISQFKDLTEDFLRRQVKKHPSIIKDIENPSEELICMAIKEEPNVILYFDNPTPAMIDVIRRNYPDLLQLLPHVDDTASI